MVALVYVSTATHLLEPAKLQALLTQSRTNNARLGVTGALLYNDGNFMQALEGDDAIVSALYATIVADPRHYDVTTILERPQPARLFGDWTMAFRNLRDPALQATPGYQTFAQLLSRSPASQADPPVILRLLCSFVQHSR